ncbi:hypothetical protein [Vulgatibacter sp.]|uniref:hypothetical protein n=1 Tax=Vulgatibacter sp. TaxID=1971226 RepID=UPI0035640034
MASPTGRQLAPTLANRATRARRPSAAAIQAAPERGAARNAARSAAREALDAERLRLLDGASQLADRLSLLLAERVRLTVTDNTSTMVSFRRTRGQVAFRVHQMFLEAPPVVVDALADYAARGKRSAGSVIDAFVRANEDLVRRSRVERQVRSLDPIGAVHDLQAIFDELNHRWFGGRIDARIGWGREAPGRRRRSIKMGTYFHDARVIKIHPSLDREVVPEFFVAFVVFHEMLHQAEPPKMIGGRRVSHTPEFRRLERAYPDYGKAIAWEREHLTLLLGDRLPPRNKVIFDPDDPLA